MAKKEIIKPKSETNLLDSMHDANVARIEPVTDMEKENVVETKKNPLFEIIDAIFRNREYIMNMTPQQANQNLFMVLRRLAINYPMQANLFNNGKVNALDVMKFWSDYLYCGSVPRWAYLSGGGDKKKKTEKDSITKNDIKEYIEFYDIDRKSFEFAMKTFREEAINEVVDFKNYMKLLSSTNE